CLSVCLCHHYYLLSFPTRRSSDLSGVFEFGLRATTLGSDLQTRGGIHGSFFSGVLATVVATPCSAPFLAPALGAALALPVAQSLDRKSTRLNSSHVKISYAVFCLK